MKTIQVSQVEHGEHLLYHNRDLTIFHSLKDFASFTEDDVLLDGFVMVLIVKGQATLTVDDRHYELHAGHLFVSVPHNVIKKVMQSVDIEVAGVFTSSEFISTFSTQASIDLTPLLIERSHRFATLGRESQQLFISYLQTVAHLLSMPGVSLADRSVITLFESLSYVLRGLVNQESEESSMSVLDAGRCAAELLVNRFLVMLDGNHGGFLKVNDYAQQLCITPKYLSAVCKSVTGQTASQLICDSIMREAKRLLRNPSLSIKEISNQLGFANSSHFGTFIRRVSGYSPQAFRTTL